MAMIVANFAPNPRFEVKMPLGTNFKSRKEHPCEKGDEAALVKIHMSNSIPLIKGTTQ